MAVFSFRIYFRWKFFNIFINCPYDNRTSKYNNIYLLDYDDNAFLLLNMTSIGNEKVRVIMKNNWLHLKYSKCCRHNPFKTLVEFKWLLMYMKVYQYKTNWKEVETLLCETENINKNPKYRIIKYKDEYLMIDLVSTWLALFFPMINWLIPKSTSKSAKKILKL